MNKNVIIGRFGSVYGIQGWLKVISFTQPMTNILHYENWLINRASSWQPITITASKLHGKHILVKIADCTTPEQARQYTNIDIAISRGQLPTLTESEYYWADLEGLSVVNQQGIELGKVSHVFATGANDVLIVKGEKEHLLPYIKQVILNINLAEKTLLVDWDENF